MGLVANSLVLSTIVCTAIYAVTRVLALLIVLRGTRPHQRAELVLAVAELFRPPFRARPQNALDPADSSPSPPPKK
ncbi:hypothetical protein ACIBQ1_14975 [Nonomuraea sp. NPDC050153]|uniref:hypothetical protein n=1 Tax=Nonomuraea sp. NPDC050153 TaxID=3364359 RepID=UPI0037B2CF0A